MGCGGDHVKVYTIGHALASSACNRFHLRRRGRGRGATGPSRPATGAGLRCRAGVPLCTPPGTVPASTLCSGAACDDTQDVPTSPAPTPPRACTGPDSPAAWVDEALALLNADPAAALALARRAHEQAGRHDDAALAGRALHAAGMAESYLGRVAEGVETLREAARVLARHGPPLAECAAWRDLGSVLTNLSGDPQAGAEALQRALALAEQVGDSQEQGMVLVRLGPLLGRLGRLPECEAALRRAAGLLQHGGDRRAYANVLVNLAYLEIQREAYAAALPPLLQARGLFDSEAHRISRLNCESNLALALAGVGRCAEATDLCTRVAAELDPASDGFQWADQLLTTGRVQLLCGDAPAAVRSLGEGLAYAVGRGLRAAEIDLLGWLSLAEERCGQLAAALRHERELRAAERRWLDEQTAERVRTLQTGVELAEKRAENLALASARDELELRVAERTSALRTEVREREAAVALARYWSEHDWLTQLPNRRLLQQRLAQQLQEAGSGGGTLGVAFIDLDGFKALNDAHGHEAGDRALRITARRLQRHAPPGATVARYGGDEFVVLLPALADARMAALAAQRLRRAVLAPLHLAGRRVSLTCSIGVALGPRDAGTPDRLLRCADRAMLQAKAAGRNQVHELSLQGQALLDRRSRLRRDLGHALAHGGLDAAFQPILALGSGRLVGAELLARWQHAELGAVSPAEFIPVAEESGLIAKLGVWALRTGTLAARALRERAAGRGDAPPRVSVNLSPRQLADRSLVNSLVTAVHAAGGRPDWLELELTESMQLAEDAAYLERLRGLRQAGFQLALDDFGAGYSSFSYLSQVYFDRLKIDRALVQAACLAPERMAVTRSIIVMAHGLGLQVVAEGIETEAQRQLLQSQDCDLVQGFLFARPMPLEALLDWPG